MSSQRRAPVDVVAAKVEAVTRTQVSAHQIKRWRTDRLLTATDLDAEVDQARNVQWALQQERNLSAVPMWLFLGRRPVDLDLVRRSFRSKRPSRPRTLPTNPEAFDAAIHRGFSEISRSPGGRFLMGLRPYGRGGDAGITRRGAFVELAHHIVGRPRTASPVHVTTFMPAQLRPTGPEDRAAIGTVLQAARMSTLRALMGTPGTTRGPIAALSDAEVLSGRDRVDNIYTLMNRIGLCTLDEVWPLPVEYPAPALQMAQQLDAKAIMGTLLMAHHVARALPAFDPGLAHILAELGLRPPTPAALLKQPDPSSGEDTSRDSRHTDPSGPR